MDKASEAILALKPVTFQYKTDKTGTPQFGLVADDVARVNPDLVVRDENGDVYTVRYDAVKVRFSLCNGSRHAFSAWRLFSSGEVHHSLNSPA